MNTTATKRHTSAVSLSITECFSIFQLIVLDFWPTNSGYALINQRYAACPAPRDTQNQPQAGEETLTLHLTSHMYFLRRPKQS